VASTARKGTPLYALAVLGGEVAAVAAAREAARRGVRVALLSPGEPAMAPSEPGDFTRAVRECQTRQGLRPPALPVDEPRIDVLRGPLWFCRYHTVMVGGVEVRFRKAIVATGSEPAPITLAGADIAEPLRPEELHRLEAPPQRLAVLGSDGSACFWAQQLHRLGSEVHLIASRSRFLEASDEQAAQLVREQLEVEGVRVHATCDEIGLDRTGYRRGLLILRGKECEKLLVDEVLVCSPRMPKLDGLRLETAAVRYSERGIDVDDWLRTSEPAIFAAGRACAAQFASLEAEEGTGRLAALNAVRWRPRRLSRYAIPHYTPTDPPVVELGPRPATLATAGIRITERRVEFREGNPSRKGLISIQLDRRGRVMGAVLVAAGAEELAVPLMLLMNRGWPIQALEELIPCRSGLAGLLLLLARR